MTKEVEQKVLTGMAELEETMKKMELILRDIINLNLVIAASASADEAVRNRADALAERYSKTFNIPRIDGSDGTNA